MTSSRQRFWRRYHTVHGRVWTLHGSGSHAACHLIHLRFSFYDSDIPTMKSTFYEADDTFSNAFRSVISIYVLQTIWSEWHAEIHWPRTRQHDKLLISINCHLNDSDTLHKLRCWLYTVIVYLSCVLACCNNDKVTLMLVSLVKKVIKDMIGDSRLQGRFPRRCAFREAVRLA